MEKTENVIKTSYFDEPEFLSEHSIGDYFVVVNGCLNDYMPELSWDIGGNYKYKFSVHTLIAKKEIRNMLSMPLVFEYLGNNQAKEILSGIVVNTLEDKAFSKITDVIEYHKILTNSPISIFYCDLNKCTPYMLKKMSEEIQKNSKATIVEALIGLDKEARKNYEQAFETVLNDIQSIALAENEIISYDKQKQK